jgi:hypothetical protein
MRKFERLYTIQEVASLTRRSVSMTKTYAARLGLGKTDPNRGRSFFYTKDDAVLILLYKTGMAKSSKKTVDNKKVVKKKPVGLRKGSNKEAP